MLPLAAMAGIGAGAGLLKSALVDSPREDRQRRLQAQLMRYSPWSGIPGSPGAVKQADPFGQAMQFGFTGAQMGQNMAQMGQTADLNKAYVDLLNRSQGFGGGMPPGVPPGIQPWRLGDYNMASTIG